MGEIVQNEEGFVLYRFDDDKVKPEVESNCNGDCAKVWPPAVINKDEQAEARGRRRRRWSARSTREDGTKQLTIDKLAGLHATSVTRRPGQWKGQNVGKKWFVITPDGTKNLTCLPGPPRRSRRPRTTTAEGDGDESGGDAGGADAGFRLQLLIDFRDGAAGRTPARHRPTGRPPVMIQSP